MTTSLIEFGIDIKMMNDTHYVLLVVDLFVRMRTIIMSDVNVVAEYVFSDLGSVFGVLQCLDNTIYELACFSAGNCTLFVFPLTSNMGSGVEIH